MQNVSILQNAWNIRIMDNNFPVKNFQMNDLYCISITNNACNFFIFIFCPCYLKIFNKEKNTIYMYLDSTSFLPTLVKLCKLAGEGCEDEDSMVRKDFLCWSVAMKTWMVRKGFIRWSCLKLGTLKLFSEWSFRAKLGFL